MTVARPLILLLACLTACVSPESANRFTRHFSAELWGGAVHGMTSNPAQLGTSLFLLGGTLAVRPFDKELQGRIDDDDHITGGNKKVGDRILTSMGIASVLHGGIELLRGDNALMIETTLGIFVGSELITELLKETATRRRPRGSGRSFPSGHASTSVALATVMARRLADSGDEWYYRLGYLAYVPAFLVASSRIEGDRHFPSDAMAGAFIGFTLGSLVYNLHYPTDDPSQPAGLSVGGWQVTPGFGRDGIAVLFSRSF